MHSAHCIQQNCSLNGKNSSPFHVDARIRMNSVHRSTWFGCFFWGTDNYMDRKISEGKPKRIKFKCFFTLALAIGLSHPSRLNTHAHTNICTVSRSLTVWSKWASVLCTACKSSAIWLSFVYSMIFSIHSFYLAWIVREEGTENVSGVNEQNRTEKLTYETHADTHTQRGTKD